MTHTHGRRDANHAEIIAALRAIGAEVYDTADLGGGFPDCVVLYNGRVTLVEIKAPGGKLTDAERDFQRRFDPVYLVVWSVEDAVDVIRAGVKR